MSDAIAGLVRIRHANSTVTVGSAYPLKGQSADFADNFDVDKLMVGGVIVGYASKNPERELTIGAKFAGASLSALQNFTLPDPLTEVDITGLEPNEINTSYNYAGGKITGKEGDDVMLEIKLIAPRAGSLTVN